MSDRVAVASTRRARLGVWALLTALVPAAIVVGIIFAASSAQIDLPEWVVVVAFIAVPLAIIVAIVVSIAAFVTGSLTARILGVVAVLVLIVEFIAGADLFANLAAL